MGERECSFYSFIFIMFSSVIVYCFVLFLSLTHSLTHTPSLTHLMTHSLIHTHSHIHSITKPHSHSLSHSHSHSLRSLILTYQCVCLIIIVPPVRTNRFLTCTNQRVHKRTRQDERGENRRGNVNIQY